MALGAHFDDDDSDLSSGSAFVFHNFSCRRYQALHRGLEVKEVKALCRACSSDTQNFEEANSTEDKGLAIHIRESESQQRISISTVS
jgi:hypothetical protein